MLSPITLHAGQAVYFASDFHLGSPDSQSSLDRERKLCRWLDQASHDAAHIFLVGDLFDFWFEYKHVVPKGSLRFIAKLTELRERGIAITFFTGNHDMWLFDYFTAELGIAIYREPQLLTINQHRILIGHGDGLGPGDHQYKLLKNFFASPLCQRLFAALHPSWGFGIAQAWSGHSRKKNLARPSSYKLKENEWLVTYCQETEAQQHHDYYVFGHRHLALDLPIGQHGARYINLGDWLVFDSYARHDGQGMQLHYFERTAEQVPTITV